MDYTIRQHNFNNCIVYIDAKNANEPSYVLKNSDKLDKEYEFYKIPHPAFKSFDTYFDNINTEQIIKIGSIEIKANQIYDFPPNTRISILLGKLNPNLKTLFDHRKNCITINLLKELINIYCQILTVKDECFEEFGFVHGDFKSNNILVSSDNLQSIQFIDFEFSLCFPSPDARQTLESNDMILYLCMPPNFEITGEFGRVFDIYLLALELKVFYKFFNNFLLELEKIFIYTDITNKSNGFIDFFLILEMIKFKLNKDLINILDNTLCAELFIIKNTILHFNSNFGMFNPLNIPVLESRLNHLKLTIKKLKIK
jgi:hypothetical protein